MTTSKEHVSALMDNQLQSEQTLNALLNDPSTFETWERYHLIGDALRDELPNQLDLMLSQRIADALEQETMIVKPDRHLFAVVKPNVKRFVQVAGQYAIAASVALAVLVGINQQHDNLAGIKQGPVLNTVPIGGSATPVSVNYNPEHVHALPSSSVMTEQQLQAERQRIARYIQDHQLQQRLSPIER
jgi:Negative regulator of sigma E activity